MQYWTGGYVQDLLIGHRPKLEGPSARNYVMAVPFSAVLALPLLIIIQLPVDDFPAAYPGTTAMVFGILVAYAAALILIWRFAAPLRFGDAPWRLWPTAPARGPDAAASDREA